MGMGGGGGGGRVTDRPSGSRNQGGWRGGVDVETILLSIVSAGYKRWARQAQ